MFDSIVRNVGPFRFPKYSGIRIQMMPFLLEKVEETIPFNPWHAPIQRMVEASGQDNGTAYLTIDEAYVEAGVTHRRPGIHVDGLCPAETGTKMNGSCGGGWGGGGGGWGGGMISYVKHEAYTPEVGFLMAASEYGCRAWEGKFNGFPKNTGDCSHLFDELKDKQSFLLQANRLYTFNALAVHESIARDVPMYRQFVRLSLPSKAPWFDNYTKSPAGILPEGPIREARKEMDYRR